MNTKHSKHSKNPGDITLPLEIDHLDQLYKEFISSEEIQNLIKQKNDLYEQIESALPEEQKPLILEYSDINSDISGFMSKYYYKYGLTDRETIKQLLLGKHKLKLDIKIL